jgi:hypothetical protein
LRGIVFSPLGRSTNSFADIKTSLGKRGQHW